MSNCIGLSFVQAGKDVMFSMKTMFFTQNLFTDSVATMASLGERVTEHDENIETLLASLGNTPGGTPIGIPDPPNDSTRLLDRLTQLEQTMTSK